GETAIVEEKQIAEGDTVTHTRQAENNEKVPEKYLQQQRNVAENLDVRERNLGDQPIARQARHTDQEAENGGQYDADNRNQEGIDHAYQKDAKIAHGFVVGNKRKQDAELGRVA